MPNEDPPPSPPVPPPPAGLIFPPPRPIPVLPYQQVAQKFGFLPVWVRVLLGCLIYGIICFVWFWLTLSYRALPPGGSFIGWVLITGGLLGFAVWLRSRYGIKGYGYGILLAFLMSALAVGGLILFLLALCFKSTRNGGA